jgi:ComF family protein
MTCGQCLQHRPDYNYCISAFEYRYPIDRMILNFKSKGQLIIGKVLANLLANTISNRLENNLKPDLMVPIPLHRSQLRSRGFNQSREIADVISRRLGIPVNNQLCRRTKKTSAQKSLSATERKANLRGAFAVVGPVLGKHIAIVDDVMTTGTTVESLAGLLYTLGAAEVQIWVIARTPRPPTR